MKSLRKPHARAVAVVAAVLVCVAYTQLGGVSSTRSSSIPRRLYDAGDVDDAAFAASDGFDRVATRYLPPVLNCSLQSPSVSQRCSDASRYWRQADGLLYVSPADDQRDVLHPIEALIADGEVRWHHKLQRQSRTLDDARAEYRRRYSMHPPKGFAAWWQYAMDKGVLLPDEYDNVMQQVMPLLSLSPDELRRRQSLLESDIDIMNQGKGKELERYWTNKLTVIQMLQGGEWKSWPRRDERLWDQVESMEEWMRRWYTAADGDLKPMNFSVWPDDETFGPTISGEERLLRLLAARSGDHIDDMLPAPQPPSTSEQLDLDPWAVACPPSSPMRTGISPKSTAPENETYIVSTRIVSDVCRWPEYKELHGTLQQDAKERRTSISSLWPIISFSALSTTSTIISAQMDNIYDSVGPDPDWPDKRPQMVWRGGTSGLIVRKGVDYLKTQRARFVSYANSVTGTATIRSPIGGGRTEYVTLPSQQIKTYLYDVGFAGDSDSNPMPQMWEGEWGRQSLLTGPMSRLWKERMGTLEENKFQYVFDTDGNGWSGRFRRLLRGKRAVLKSSIYREWHSFHHEPWYHYIPVQFDLSDLDNIMSFFVGLPPDHQGAHSDLGNRIARNGQEFADRCWRDEDWKVYMARVFLEWQRVWYREEDKD